MFELNGKYSSAKVMIDSVEPECISQLLTNCNHPAFTNPIVVMPDCHKGNSCTIGFTMKMTDKVIPAIVGVDIGCGVMSVNIGKNMSHSLEELDRQIRKAIPFGFDTHDKPVFNMEKQFDWNAFEKSAVLRLTTFIFDTHKCYSAVNFPIDYKWYDEMVHRIGANKVRISNSVATLGGGNHFIECGVDGAGDYWITVHTGSRNLGKQVCDYWQDKAVKIIKDDKQKILDERIKQIRMHSVGQDINVQIKKARQELGIDNIANKDLCYLEEHDAVGYLLDMMMAQEYARVNREQIMHIIVDKILNVKPIDKIESVHNFIDFSSYIIRKGAIRSYIGERLVVPFNMRDGILVCEGKSNPEWNYSAPHGAGRLMSRSKAKKTLSMDEFKEQMKDICSSSVCQGTLDEAPNAYKDAQIIEDAIEPTAKILFKIKPVLNMKSGGESERD